MDTDHGGTPGDILSAPDQLQDLVSEGLSLPRMDFLHDQLKLVGQVLALRTLIEVITFGDKDSSRVAAARILMQTGENPEDIARRLKSAPWADLNMKQLEHVVDRLTGGETDLKKLIQEAKDVCPPPEGEKELV